MKVQNLKPLSPFVFFLALTCQKIFIQTLSIESRRVIGPENRLFVGTAASFSTECVQAPAVKGLNESITLAGHGPQTELQLISPSVKKRNIKQKTAATTTASKQIIKTNRTSREEQRMYLH